MLSATNHPDPLAEPVTASGASTEPESSPAPMVPLPTALSAALGLNAGKQVHPCGASTPLAFNSVAAEVEALFHGAGVSDLGYRGKLLVTGSDRLRWLNGMVSNTVQALPEGQGNYSFLLSVQGRIQGDCRVYRRAGDLLLDTGLDQVSTLLSHLDHFVIMDDVELKDVSQEWTALSLAGPAATQVITTLGVALQEPRVDNARMSRVMIGEVDCTLIELPPAPIPRYELWFAPKHVLAVWETLQAAGAVPCGFAATETLRVWEATPLYGVDLNDRDLPQETAQNRALNFSKGCYLGQEIVERIRSRGKVNRLFRQFSLKGRGPATLPAELLSNGQPVGRITSTALLGKTGMLALGFVRLEAVERNAEITCDGEVVTALAAAPAVDRPVIASN